MGKQANPLSDYGPVSDFTCHEVTGAAWSRGSPGPLWAHLWSLFAYQLRTGVEDADIFLPHGAYTHMEEAGSTVRVMLIDLFPVL